MFINSVIKNNIQDMGINIFFKNHVSSTNDYIKYQYIKDKVPIVIFTNNQRNPRGRRGSLWYDYQINSLSFTLCIKLNGSISNYENLSQIIGLSVIKSCEQIGMKNLKLKIPNDIFYNEKQVCGKLVENNIQEKNFFYSAIGIGLNLSIPDNLLKIIEGNPGNLVISPDKVDDLLLNILRHIFSDIHLLQQGGFKQFVNLINQHKILNRGE